MIVDLSTLGAGMDLSKVTGRVVFKNTFDGERLILENPSNVMLDFSDAHFKTTHLEDCLILKDPRDCVVFGGIFTNALTVWGDTVRLKIEDCIFLDAHTGIRLTQHNTTEIIDGVHLKNITILDPSHEGVYVGNHSTKAPLPTNIVIEGVVVKNAGWDGIQVRGRFLMKDCAAMGCARKKIFGQDGSVTVQPGSVGQIANVLTDGRFFILDSKVFINPH